MAQDISTIIPGFKSVKEVEIAAKIGEEFNGLTPEEENLFMVDLGKYYCRDCGLCLSCSRKLNIPALLRFYDLYKIYNLKNWAKELYTGLDVKAYECDNCGICEPKCPHNIPIRKFLDEICNNFKGEDHEE